MSGFTLGQESRTPWLVCPSCGYKTDGASIVGHDGRATNTPSDGNACVCLACAALNIYVNGATALRLPTADERAEAATNPTVQAAVQAIVEARQRDHSWPRGPKSPRGT